MSSSSRSWMNWSQGFATAACVSLCVLFGYWIGSASPSAEQPSKISNTIASTELNTQASWVERVADYQSLYVANTVNRIVPNRSKDVELLDLIQQRTGMQTEIPDLSEAGYEFVRVQELGYRDEPLVQLIYSKSGSTPLALCYMPSNGSADTELVMANYHGLGTASWIDSGQRFVLVGNEGESQLRELYSSVRNVF